LTTKVLLTTHWFEFFTPPQRPSSKASRIQYCQLLKPLLPLQLDYLETAQRLFNRLAATGVEKGAAAYSQSGV